MTHDVSRHERAKRFGHAGAVVWLTGLPGAGKSTLARLLERRLFDAGYATFVLDGDNARRRLKVDLALPPLRHAFEKKLARRLGRASH